MSFHCNSFYCYCLSFIQLLCHSAEDAGEDDEDAGDDGDAGDAGDDGDDGDDVEDDEDDAKGGVGGEGGVGGVGGVISEYRCRERSPDAILGMYGAALLGFTAVVLPGRLALCTTGPKSGVLGVVGGVGDPAADSEINRGDNLPSGVTGGEGEGEEGGKEVGTQSVGSAMNDMGPGGGRGVFLVCLGIVESRVVVGSRVVKSRPSPASISLFLGSACAV